MFPGFNRGFFERQGQGSQRRRPHPADGSERFQAGEQGGGGRSAMRMGGHRPTARARFDENLMNAQRVRPRGTAAGFDNVDEMEATMMAIEASMRDAGSADFSALFGRGGAPSDEADVEAIAYFEKGLVNPPAPPEHEGVYGAFLGEVVVGPDENPRFERISRAAGVVRRLLDTAEGPADIDGCMALLASTSGAANDLVFLTLEGPLSRIYRTQGQPVVSYFGTQRVNVTRFVLSAAQLLASRTTACEGGVQLESSDTLFWFWLWARLLDLTAYMPPLQTHAVRELAKCVVNAMTFLGRSTEIVAAINTMQDLGQRHMLVGIIDTFLSLFLPERPERFRLVRALWLPELARICRMKYPEVKANVNFSWPMLLNRITSCETGLLDNRDTFGNVFDAVLGSMVAENHDSNALQSDLLKQAFQQRKDLMSWDEWMHVVNACHSRFSKLEVMRHMAAVFKTHALHVIASCPEHKLVGIIEWIHVQLYNGLATRAPGSSNYGTTLFSALLPGMFADPRCRDTIFRYIIANGLHLEGSFFHELLQQHASSNKRNVVLMRIITKNVELESHEGNTCVRAAFELMGNEDKVLKAVADGLVPAQRQNCTFLYGIDKASDVLVKIGQQSNTITRAMKFFDDADSAQQHHHLSKSAVELPPVLDVGYAFASLLRRCGDLDKAMIVLLRSIEALEHHTLFRKEPSPKQLQLLLSYFSCFPLVPIVDQEVVVEHFQSLLKPVFWKGGVGSDVGISPMAIEAVLTKDESQWAGYILEMLVLAGQGVLAHSANVMSAVLPVMVGAVSQTTARSPYTLRKSLVYLKRYLETLMRALCTERDDSAGIVQLFQLRFSVFLADIGWDRVANRFTNFEIAALLHSLVEMRNGFISALLDGSSIPVNCLLYVADNCKTYKHHQSQTYEYDSNMGDYGLRTSHGRDRESEGLSQLKSRMGSIAVQVITDVRNEVMTLQGPVRILHFLLRYDIADLRELLQTIVPPHAVIPVSGWLGQPSVLVTTLLEEATYVGQLTQAAVNAVSNAMKTIFSYIGDVHYFLNHFVVHLKNSSTVFRKYMDSQLGRLSVDDEAAFDDARKHIALTDGSMQREILAVRDRLRILARADVISKAELVLIAKMLENSNVYNDVEVLKLYFDERDDDPSITCTLPPTERLHVLRRVIRQLQVLDLINSMAAGLEKHGLGRLMTQPEDPMPFELIRLKDYLEEDRDNVTLTLVKPDSECMAKFQTLSAAQMELLKHCGRYADFKKWIMDMKFFDEPGSNEGTERFNRMINYVTQLLQGESYDEEVLLALMESVPIMTMFRTPASLTELVSTIGKCQLTNLRRLNLVEKSLSVIQDWFDDNVSHTFGEVIAQLKAVMDDGRAVINCPRLQSGVAPVVSLEIHFVMKRQSRSLDRILTEEQLADFAQAVIFHASESGPTASRAQSSGGDAALPVSSTTNGEGSVASNVARFLEAIDVLRELRVVTQKLFTEVHVVAMSHDEELCVRDVEGNREKLEDLRLKLSERHIELKRLRHAHPLLSCMLLPQTLHVMERLQWCQSVAVGAEEDLPLQESLQAEIVTALSFCGVDVSSVMLTNGLVLGEAFHDDTVGLPHMYRLGQWLDQLQQHPDARSLLVGAEDCIEDIGHAKGSIGVFAVDAIDGTPVDVYCRLASLYKSKAPHWSQVLWCTSATTEFAVTTFFERCESNTNAVYTLVAPHALPRDLWDTVQASLLHLIHGTEEFGAEETKDSDDVDMGTNSKYHQGPRCRLAVVFTKDCSTRRLCVNTIPSDRLRATSFTTRFGSFGVRTFVGRSGDGKSYSISKHLEASVDRYVTKIRVNEGFSMKNFLDRFGSDDSLVTALSQRSPMSFVFYVSAYAPFEEFDRFLFSLFVTGLLWAPQCAKVVSLPCVLDIEVLIEIPNAVPTHDGVNTVRRIPGASSLDEVNIVEGTVGNTMSKKAMQAGMAVHQKQAHRCPCIDCVRRITLGIPFDESRGCAHMLPVLTCMPVVEEQVLFEAKFEAESRFMLALRMLKAYTIPLPPLRRAVVSGKMNMPNACGCSCPPRFLIDAVAVENDRVRPYITQRELAAVRNAGGIAASFKEYEVVFDDPQLNVQDVMVFFQELAAHFDESNMASISGSKRQMTYFLSYLSRAAEFWASAPGLRTNVFQVHLGSVLFEQMIMRCMDLCNRKLRSDWRSFPHQFLILLDNELQLLSSLNVTETPRADGLVESFRCGYRGQVLPDKEGGRLPYDFSHDKVIRIKAPDAASLLGDSPMLKRQLSVGLGVNLEKLTKLLADHNYILTFDFLMKMLHIRERRLALVPTIIEGETGVGKTKLLNVYAAIETMGFLDSFRPLKAVVEVLFQTLNGYRDHCRSYAKAKLSKELKSHENTLPRVFRACVQAFVEVQTHEPEKLVSFVQSMRGCFEGVLFHHPLFNVHQCLFYAKTLLEDPKTTRRVDLQGDVASGGFTTEVFHRLHMMDLDKVVTMLRGMWEAASDRKSPGFATTFDASFGDAAQTLKSYADQLTKKIEREVRPVPPKEGEVVDDADKPFQLSAVQEFSRFCLAWLMTEAAPTFHTILMHAAYTVDDLRRELLPVVKFAARATKCFSKDGREAAAKVAKDCKLTETVLQALISAVGGYHGETSEVVSFVVFLDEVNTSSILGTVQDVMLDNALEGQELPKNIFWVCATNPFRQFVEGDSSATDASGDRGFRAHYQVRPVPEAMELVKWHFGSLTADAESDYISAKMREVRDASCSVAASAAAVVQPADAFLTTPSGKCGPCGGDSHWSCSHPLVPEELVPFTKLFEGEPVASESVLRDMPWCNHILSPTDEDICRMTDIIGTAHTFVKTNEGESAVSQRDLQRVFKALQFFWNHLIRRDANNLAALDVPERRSGLLCWATLLAVGLVYYLRLDEDARRRMSDAIAVRVPCDGRTLVETMDFETQQYIRHVKLEPGIAQNKALKENVFAIIACVQLKMPLIIVGPPGSSKTLSFQIVQHSVLNDATVREGMSSVGCHPFFSGFMSMEAGVFHYQCSEHSTSNEVKTVFERAIHRQSSWAAGRAASARSDSLRRTAVVFMDEAGLPEDAKESLKVLHYYLENPVVSFVAITNRPLDAAKMNRAVVLFRPAADKQELGLLLAGSLGEGPEMAANLYVCAFRDAYHALMARQEPLAHGGVTFRRRYGLRDFYNFGRYFARRCKVFPPTDVDILHSLERNFHGVTKPEFETIAWTFFERLEALNGQDDLETRVTARVAKLRYRSVIDVLREALADTCVDATRMNETIVRYQLVLDDSEDDSAVRLLFQCGILNRSKTIVFDLSDFPDDRNDVVRSTLISNIKHAMVQGKTVFLMHTAPIHGSLYDVLNQHFTRMDKREGVVYYAMVALGSYSRPCQIHKDFRIIVHLPTRMRAPAPFYNRFEKYLVSVSSLWEDVLADRRLKEAERSLLKQALVAVERTVCEAVNQDGLVGFVQSSTVASVLLSKALAFADRNRVFCRLKALVEGIAASTTNQEEFGTFLDTWASKGLAVGANYNNNNADDEGMFGIGSFTFEDIVMDSASTVLQIATPNAMLAAQSKLPTRLVAYYLEEQEHFDVAKIATDVQWDMGDAFLSQSSAHAEGCNGVDFSMIVDTCMYRPVKKTMAFTLMGDAMGQLPDTTPEGSVTLPFGGLNGKLVAVMNFTEVSTQKECEGFLKAFVDPNNPCASLLVLVDLRAAGNRRVNSLRQMIDDCGETMRHLHMASLEQRVLDAAKDTGSTFGAAQLSSVIETFDMCPTKHVVVCLLIPATWVTVQCPYPALFLNGWRCTYVDSFVDSEGSISAGSWMKVACGLEEGFTSECAVALRGLNTPLLKAIALRVTGCRAKRHFDSAGPALEAAARHEYVALEPFYMDPATRMATLADRVEALSRLQEAMGGDTLASLLAGRFLHLFGKDVIVEQLRNASNRCASGMSSRGLTVELNDSLRVLYERFAAELYHKAAAGFNLQSLYVMYKRHGSTELTALHGFTVAALEDLCVSSLKSLQGLVGEASKVVSHGLTWEWQTLPFLYHIAQEANKEIATLRSCSDGGIIDASGLQSLNTDLMAAFPHLLPKGRLLDVGVHGEDDITLLQSLLLQSVARMIGGLSAVVYAQHRQFGATEKFAHMHLRYCVKGYNDVATLLVFNTSSSRRPLQRQLAALAKLEQAGLVSEADVIAACSTVEFLPFSDSDSSTDTAVIDHNSTALLQALWNLLVVRLWIGLCDTFGARSEVDVVCELGLPVEAGRGTVSPWKWAQFANDAVVCLEPIGQQLRDAPTLPAHRIVMDSLKIVTPLVALLFPTEDTSKSGKAADKKRVECVRSLLPIIREHCAQLLTSSGASSLRYMRLVHSAARLLPDVRERLPLTDLGVVFEFVERVFVDCAGKLATSLASRQDVPAPAFAEDIRVVVHFLCGTSTPGIVLPEALCVHVLGSIVSAIVGVNPVDLMDQLSWFHVIVNEELTLASPAEPAKPLVTYKFVPDWWRNCKLLCDAEEYPTHPCLTSLLSRTLFKLYQPYMVQGGVLPATRLPLELRKLWQLNNTMAATFPSETGHLPWHLCIEAALCETAVLESLVSDMAPSTAVSPTKPRFRRKDDNAGTLVMPTLRQLSSGSNGRALHGCLQTILASEPAHLYALGKALERYGREHMAKIVNNTDNVRLLGPDWLKSFQIVFPLQCAGEDGGVKDVVRAMLMEQDFHAQLPFMWPRPVSNVVTTTRESVEDREESREFSEFRKRAIMDFVVAGQIFTSSGPEACRNAMVPWLVYFREFAGGDGAHHDNPLTLRARMFLFCVVAWCWFDKDEADDRRCHAVCEVMDEITPMLDLDEREARLYAAFADPDSFFCKDEERMDDITQLFFKSEPRAAEDKRPRSVVLGMVAAILGLPRGSHPYHTHLFSPHSLAGTFGVGSARESGIGGIHYDCGTQLQPATGELGAGRNSLLDKGVVSSLYITCFGVLALGLALFPEEHVGCYGPVFSRFFGQNNTEDFGRAASRHSRNERDWLINFVYTRLNAGWIVLSNFAIMSSDDRIVTLMAAVGEYRRAVLRHPGVCDAVMRSSEQREQFECVWKDECFLAMKNNLESLMKRLDSGLSQNALLGKLSAMRQRIAPQPPAVEKLPTVVDQLGGACVFQWLKYVHGRTGQFRSFLLIPDLVTLYDWLYDTQAHLLTIEDANTITIGKLFQDMSANPLRTNEVHRMRDLYLVVCDRWNALHRDLGGELAVGACMNGQKFVPINLDVAVGIFLTYPDDETNDLLLKVLDFLISVQNSFLEKIPDADRPAVSPNAITESSLVPDVTQEFTDYVSMYSLNSEEMLERGTICPFMLDRIAHAIQPLISKPKIEPTGLTINRKFPFRSAMSSVSSGDVDMDQANLQMADDVVRQVSRGLEGILDAAALSMGEQESLMQRLSTVGPGIEKHALDFLVMVARVIAQFVDSFRTDARRKNASLLWDVDGGDVSTAIAEDVQRRVAKEINPEESIEAFASREGLSPDIRDMTSLQLCRSVLFARPLGQLTILLEVLAQRRLMHANQFTRFPPYMKTPIPADVKAEFDDNLAREFGGDTVAEVEALTTLQRILEDNELETDVSNGTGLDEFSMKYVLSVYARLDDADCIHQRIANVLPDGIRGRSHYCELLQTVYCRAVKLRASVMQATKYHQPVAVTADGKKMQRLPTREEVMAWSRLDVERFLSSDLGCSSEVVCKIVVDSGAALLKYSKADLENTALGLSQEDITKVSSAILSILE